MPQVVFNPFTASFDFVGSSGGSGSPGGSNTQIQFNDSGSFGGDADLTWDKTANELGIAGDITFIDGANRIIQIADQATTNANGDGLIISGAKGNGSGYGGPVELSGGIGGDSGNDGGDIFIGGGQGGLGGGNGGTLEIRGGLGTNGGSGGLLNIHSGDSETSNSGNLQLDVGVAGPTGSGGFAQVHAGDGGSISGDGGVAEVQGGNAINGNAGYAALLAGQALIGTGGDVILSTGSGTIADGQFKFQPKSATTVSGILDFDSLASTDKTFTFPNQSGTIALLSDISGSTGIVRSIVTTSGNVTAGATASTDYAYLVAGAHTVTLPTAVSNTNRYTIKNNHSAAITIDTTSSQTIDGTTSISINPQSSVDIISNNTNWNII